MHRQQAMAKVPVLHTAADSGILGECLSVATTSSNPGSQGWTRAL